MTNTAGVWYTSISGGAVNEITYTNETAF